MRLQQSVWTACASEGEAPRTPAKIAFLVDCYEGPYAGTEQQLLQLIRGLDPSRYAPTLALLRSTPFMECSSFPCPVEILGVGRLRKPGALWTLAAFAARLRAGGCRLVHCFLNDSSLIAPLFRLFGMPIVVSRRDMGFWHTPMALAVLRLGSPFVARYVANCRAVGELVHRREWVPRRKISVIHNGHRERSDVVAPHNDSSAAMAGVPDGARVVGLVANLRPVKRIDTLLEALALIHLQHPDVWAVVVGADGPGPTGASMRAWLSTLAERLSVDSRVLFTGRAVDPGRCIERFSVAVLCSQSEGLSNSLIEYMQAGRAIVCTDTGGNPELIQHGYNGFLVPVGDSEALAARIVELLSDPGLSRRMGEAARDSARALCDDSRMVSEQMSCYDLVLEHSPPKRGHFEPSRRPNRC